MRALSIAMVGVPLMAGLVACSAPAPSEPVQTPRGVAPIDVIPAEGLTYVLSRIERQTAAPFVIADLRDCADGIGSIAEAVYDSLHFQPDGGVYRAVARRTRGFTQGVENLAALYTSKLRGAGAFTRFDDTVQVSTLLRGGEHPMRWDASFRIDGEHLVLRMTAGGRCEDGSQGDKPRPADWIYAIAR